MRAAVLGSPIQHSKSPQLHLAAYRALGLRDWSYERIECSAEQLPGLVEGLGPDWVGLSVTMPGKVAALGFADELGQIAPGRRAALIAVRVPRDVSDVEEYLVGGIAPDQVTWLEDPESDTATR